MLIENNLFEKWPPVSKAEWLELIQKDLKGADFGEKLVSEYSGIKVQPIYTAVDLPETIVDSDNEFNEADEEQEDAQVMTWSPCREIFFSSESDIYALADPAQNHGALCVHVSGDIKSFLQQFRMVRPEANHFVLAINDDLSDHDSVSLYRQLVGNIGGHQLLISAIEFDPIGYWMKTGYIKNKQDSFQHLAEIYFKLTPVLHDCKIIHVDGSIAAEAGASITEQLAYALAIAEQYLIEMDKRNVPLEELIQLFNFRFSVKNEFFFEIAKLRAFERLWINLVKAFIPDVYYIPKPHIHATTSQINLAIVDIYNNLLRTTSEAMSAILGGCEILSLHPYNVQTKMQDENAERFALNIQHLLRYESSFDAYRQMAEGAYYIESLTTTIAENAWKHFQEISGAGGFVHCLEKGIIQNEIELSRNNIISEFNNEKYKMVGVNIHQNKDEVHENIVREFVKTETAFPTIQPFQLNP